MMLLGLSCLMSFLLGGVLSAWIVLLVSMPRRRDKDRTALPPVPDMTRWPGWQIVGLREPRSDENAISACGRFIEDHTSEHPFYGRVRYVVKRRASL